MNGEICYLQSQHKTHLFLETILLLLQFKCRILLHHDLNSPVRENAFDRLEASSDEGDDGLQEEVTQISSTQLSASIITGMRDYVMDFSKFPS